METPNRFYTYAYLREDGTPYYIGKGKGNRLYTKEKDEIRKPKDKNRIIFLKQNLNEEEAFRHEIYMIAVFGRKDLRTGILRNKTNGGEGASGHRHSEEHKKKISLILQGIKREPFTEEHRKKISESLCGSNNPNYGKSLSDKIKKKLSNAKKGRKKTEEHRKKLSDSLKGKKRKPFTEEHKKNLSKANKGEKNPNYGKVMSQNAKEKLSKKIKGRHWWNNGQICKHCVECPGDGWVRGRLPLKRR